MSHLTHRIAHGPAQAQDVDLLVEVASQIRGKCLCALGEFSIEAVQTGIERFRSDFEQSVGLEPAIPETTQVIGS